MPFTSEVHVDSALSSFASAYQNGDLFADIVCPVIEVDKRSGKFFKRSRADVSSLRDDLMGPDSEANRSTYAVTTDSYSVQDRGLKDVVSNETIDNADEPLAPLMDATDNLMMRLMLKRERRAATLLLTSGNYAAGNTSAVANAWSNAALGTPLADIHTALSAVAPGDPGATRTVMIMALETWFALSRHPDMLGGGATSAVLTKDAAAALLGVDQICVSNATYNTANEGQTASYSRVWTAGSVAIVRVPRSAPRGFTSLFAGTFRFKPSGGQAVTVRRWEEPALGPRGSQAVQVSFSDDESVIQNDMGYLLTGC